MDHSISPQHQKNTEHFLHTETYYSRFHDMPLIGQPCAVRPDFQRRLNQPLFNHQKHAPQHSGGSSRLLQSPNLPLNNSPLLSGMNAVKLGATTIHSNPTKGQPGIITAFLRTIYSRSCRQTPLHQDQINVSVCMYFIRKFINILLN